MWQECWVVCILWNTWSRELEVLNICLSGDDMELLFSSLLTRWSSSTRYSSLVSLNLEIAALVTAIQWPCFLLLSIGLEEGICIKMVFQVLSWLFWIGAKLYQLLSCSKRKHAVQLFNSSLTRSLSIPKCVWKVAFPSLNEEIDTSTRFMERQILLEGQ